MNMLQERSELHLVFGQRYLISKTKNYELAILSVPDPKKNDVVLDPFAGSGVIPIHRASFK